MSPFLANRDTYRGANECPLLEEERTSHVVTIVPQSGLCIFDQAAADRLDIP